MMPIRHQVLSLATMLLAIGLIASAEPPARAQAPEPPPASRPMPLEIQERLWLKPGPERSGPGAPGLLVMWPRTKSTTAGGDALSYGGRVEPADAQVTLNGEKLQVWPGGVFVGTRAIAPGSSETWVFRARARGKVTVVRRQVNRPAPVPPAPAWPATIHRYPISPTGDHYVAEGEPVEIRAWASDGARVEARIGASGPWTALESREGGEARGALYGGTLAPPAPSNPPRLEAVELRAVARKGAQTTTDTRVTTLKVATLARSRGYQAGIVPDRGTFFKAATGPERWGNFLQGTLVPFSAIRGDRMRADFGREWVGYMETEQVEPRWALGAYQAPALGAARASLRGNLLRIAWPERKEPLAAVFQPIEAEPGAGPSLMHITLPGAATARPLTRAWKPGNPVTLLKLVGGDAQKAPALSLDLAAPLWGFDARCTPERGFELLVRTRPSPIKQVTGQPLAGWRLMLDAGHGGDDSGALGPSGLAEADINLVQAAWLECELKALGADIAQTRRGDDRVELDTRIEMARGWDPDLFISLHHNSVGSGQSPTVDRGSIVFYHYPHSEALARAIAGPLTPVLGPAGAEPRIKAQVFRVNRNVSLCPSVLIETGYLCNPEDETPLRRTETIKATARAIAAGVRAYLAPETAPVATPKVER